MKNWIANETIANSIPSSCFNDLLAQWQRVVSNRRLLGEKKGKGKRIKRIKEGNNSEDGKRRSCSHGKEKKWKLWILHSSRPPCRRSQLPEIGGSWATSKSRRKRRHRQVNGEDVENGTRRRKWNETGEEWEQLDDDEQGEGGGLVDGGRNTRK